MAGPQTQSFDPVAEAQAKWPGLANMDPEALYDKLSDPSNFRAAFPQYSQLDDATIKRNMAANDPLVTGRGMIARSGRQAHAAATLPADEARLPGEYGAAEKPGILTRAAQAITGVPHPLDQITGREVPMLASEPGEYLGKAAKQIGELPALLAYGATVHPLDTSEQIMPINRTIGDVRAKNYRAAAGDVLGGLANVAGIEKGADELPATAERTARVANAIGVPTELPEGAQRAIQTTGRAALMPARKVAESLTIGTEPADMVQKGVMPAKRAAPRFNQAVRVLGPDLREYDAHTPIRGVQDLAEAMPKISKDIMEKEVNPVARAHAKDVMEPERFARVEQAVRDSVNPNVEEFDPNAARDVLGYDDPETGEHVPGLADKLARARTVGDIIGTGPRNRGGLLGYINGKLDSYFAKYPAARRMELATNPDTAAWEAARRSLREELMDYLEQRGERGIRNARQRYGAAQEILKQAEQRVGQMKNAKPASLYRTLGWIGAVPTGGVSAIFGELANHLNQPDVLVRRGIARIPDVPVSRSMPVQGEFVPPTFEIPHPQSEALPSAERRALPNPADVEPIVTQEPEGQRLLGTNLRRGGYPGVSGRPRLLPPAGGVNELPSGAEPIITGPEPLRALPPAPVEPEAPIRTRSGQILRGGRGRIGARFEAITPRGAEIDAEIARLEDQLWRAPNRGIASQIQARIGELADERRSLIEKGRRRVP